MKIIRTVFAAVILAMFSAACNPKPLEVTVIEEPAPDPEPEPEPEPKPEAPKLKFTYAIFGVDSQSKDVNGVVCCEVGTQLYIEAICEKEVSYNTIDSQNSKVAEVLYENVNSWIISTKYPGRAEIVLEIEDEQEEIYDYSFYIDCFGHIKLEAESTPVFGKAGFSVIDQPFDELTGQVYISSQLYGWPHSTPTDTLRLTVPASTSNVTINKDSDYYNLIDYSGIEDTMYDTWTGGMTGSGEYYCPHGMDMNFVFKLDNPYVIVDMKDDPTGEKSYQFYLRASCKTDSLSPTYTE